MGKNIWVVEDDASIAEIISYILEDNGFMVSMFSSAKNFTDAILLHEKPVDAFIIDVMLPDGTGVDLCHLVRSHMNYSETPVLMMSAHADGQEIANRCKIDGFIAKPFDLNDFSKRVDLSLAS